MGNTRSPIEGTQLKVRVGITIGGTVLAPTTEGENAVFYTLFFLGQDDSYAGVTITGDTTTNSSDIDSDGKLLCLVDTTYTGPGVLRLRATLDIPDNDFSEEDTDTEDTDTEDTSTENTSTENTSTGDSSSSTTGYRREVAECSTGIRVYPRE